MLMFTRAISPLTTSDLPWFMDLTFQILMQYYFLQHQSLLSPPGISRTECHFCFGQGSSFFSGSISFLFLSSILYTDWPGGLIFQCHIFLSFYTVHWILKARLLKQFAIPFSSAPCFVSTLFNDPSVLADPARVFKFLDLCSLGEAFSPFYNISVRQEGIPSSYLTKLF